MVPPLLGSALAASRISVGWGYDMSSISCARISCVDIEPNRIRPGAPLAVAVRNAIRRLAVVLGAACLAACAQSSVVTQRSELRAGSQTSLEHNRKTAFVTEGRVAHTKKHT